MRYFGWALQILILTGGIHLFVRFVRTTRGNPLIRGLFMSVLVGVVGLWGLATLFGLEELQHILQGSTGFIVVGLAIIFHPELRRGITQLGERPFARAHRESSADTVRKIVEASTNMAKRRDGALIAIEREVALRTVVETGSPIGARMNARLLESIFHPGAALHDGAVVVREDRIAAAGCILPLSQGNGLDVSKGTRHRAALGLSEVSDAVVVVVSEETGTISVACEGSLSEAIAPDKLEAELRKNLSGGRDFNSRGPGFLTAVARVIRADFGWIAASMLLAWGAWFTAHQSIRNDTKFVLRIVDLTDVGRRTPEPGELLILPPAANMRVRPIGEDQSFEVTVSGSRGQVNELGGQLSGTLEIEDASWRGGPIELGSVRWEDSVVGLDYRWSSSAPPELETEVSDSARFQLEPAHVLVVADRIDPRFEARLEDILFEPGPSIEISGPKGLVSELGTTIPLQLEPIVLRSSDRGEVRSFVRLATELLNKNLALAKGSVVQVMIPVLPVQLKAGMVRKDIALICLTPEKADLLQRWRLPANAQTARLTVDTAGLIPTSAEPGSAALVERKAMITRFVEENLRVYVDVGELPPPEEGRSVDVKLAWVKEWRDEPEALGLDPGILGDWEELLVRLESESSILLEPLPDPDESP